MLHAPNYGLLVFTNKYQFSQKEKRGGLRPLGSTPKSANIKERDFRLYLVFLK